MGQMYHAGVLSIITLACYPLSRWRVIHYHAGVLSIITLACYPLSRWRDTLYCHKIGRR